MTATPAAEEDQPLLVQIQEVDVARDPDAVQSVIQGIQDEPQPPVNTSLPLPLPGSPRHHHHHQEGGDDAESPRAEEPESDSGSDSGQDTEAECSSYWDVHTMAPLNATSAAAVARLRAYKPPPFPLWDRLPLCRRAAVLLLLYADRRGDLRVVITMRAANLRSFSGHAALPGGKADSLDESPYQIARREAYEEIGLPMDDSKLPPPFRIEHLCYLPMNLARTELVVRPCVALLHTGEGLPPLSPAPGLAPLPGGGSSSSSSIPTSPAPKSPPPAQSSSSSLPSSALSSSASLSAPAPASTTPTAEESLVPRLDGKEVAAVFSAPFHNFLKESDETPVGGKPLPPGKWYEGNWTTWNDLPWRVHFFYVPVTNQRVIKPKVRATGLAKLSENGGVVENGNGNGVEEDGATRYKVWGMTARILVDAATIAYGETPEFEHNKHFGDEEMIEALAKIGRLGEKKRPGSTLTAEDVKRAKEVMNDTGQHTRRKGEESKI